MNSERICHAHVCVSVRTYLHANIHNDEIRVSEVQGKHGKGMSRDIKTAVTTSADCLAGTHKHTYTMSCAGLRVRTGALKDEYLLDDGMGL